MIDHGPFVHLVAGRELGGLDDAEAIELDRHLVGCAGCAAEARAFGDTMADLALVAPARHPPRSLQGSIMTAIRAVTLVYDPTSRPAAVMGGEGSSWRRWVLRSWPRPLTAGLAAALVTRPRSIGPVMDGWRRSPRLLDGRADKPVSYRNGQLDDGASPQWVSGAVQTT